MVRNRVRNRIPTHLINLSIGASLIALSGIASVPASAQSCHELWVERNGYYKDAGHCFKTSRAISYFGNRGCVYEFEGEVPLPRGIRARINQIRALERRFGCD
ncbi:YARHG domain-containing protein [Rhodopseudomonas thermotolerans]|uniref:YARHG domain-containing protein n=2 Tax=Rhodopseudomonas TaxID=1073 RepID=A0A336JJ59_9BRAD|nr:MULTISPECIES: YARHG domain-containing protein [Rhodopseudomonas]RED38282.1 YARHG domain-containing protein [Rhodopseudomonas pentothenatexigens]REG05867.1 YARHG domain-containing protein [Rhodopseudomonas thermotolerans]SSW89735.1 YARHG domain-containing protein [Rhodopseudomonas pentothenatexigens]